MRKIILGVALMLSVATFAQKDELRTLKKFQNNQYQPSENELEKFNNALNYLESNLDLLDDNEKLDFYISKLRQPVYEYLLLYKKNPNDKFAIEAALKKFEDIKFLEVYGKTGIEARNLAKKLGKHEQSKGIDESINLLKNQLSESAFKLNQEKKYKEASSVFYSLYKLDNEDGSNLENAAILAVQAEDYKLAEKMYEEYKDSDYLNNGAVFYAMNKATDVEDVFTNRESRVKAIAIKTHEKPRDEKVSVKKPEVYKMLAIVTLQNGNIEKAKPLFTEAIKLNPNDQDLLTREFSLYFNEGYEYLKEDDKLVTEINANANNKSKYDELIAKRNAMFRRALPSFEKAYEINSNDSNTKILLKTCYEILGMKDKAATIK
ncbi:MAG: tetratricopeptide repeat protein [Flavobacterium sp.]|jgi:tetratricopeptide (TPR) repeat protein